MPERLTSPSTIRPDEILTEPARCTSRGELSRPRGLSLLGLALASMPILIPAPALAESKVVTISASVTKPLTLAFVQNLDLGSIALGPGSWSGAVIGISRSGALSCANLNVTCSGTTSVAQYHVTGSNRQVVRINAPNVTMVNQSDPSRTLVLTIDNPGSVTLPNSGQPGATFSLGGSLTLSSETVSGVYSGTFNVTVDY